MENELQKVSELRYVKLWLIETVHHGEVYKKVHVLHFIKGQRLGTIESPV